MVALFVGCEYGTKSMTATRIRVQFVALMIIPLVRTNASFWFECTGLDGANEMRWQMAGANASDANSTDDESFFEMTEAELYGTACRRTSTTRIRPRRAASQRC